MKMENNLSCYRIPLIALAVVCFFCLVSLGKLNSKPNEEGIIMEEDTIFLIDDFSKEDGVSSFGTNWRMFTDRVMGGVSTASSGYEVVYERRCLRLKGLVSLENNGGFVQVALPLEMDGRMFDASEYKGVRLWVWGNGENYYIHLRTDQTRLPWQYFQGEFSTNDTWKKVEIPFQNFKPENLNSPLNTRALRRIAVVAIKKEFQADVAVSRLEFYR